MKYNDIINVLINTRAPRTTLGHIKYASGATQKYCKRVLKEVVAAGLARCEKRNANDLMDWYYIGSRKKLKGMLKSLQKPNKNRDKVWKAIRISKPVFNRKTLGDLTGVSLASIDDFLKVLAHHNVIKKVGRDKNGTAWQLVKDPGPQRPVLSEKPKKKAGKSCS